MKLQELASLMDISKNELIEQLESNDIIELKLVERSKKEEFDIGKIEVLG